MPRPIRCTIFPDHYAANLRLAKARAPHAFLWAVVKADAYGHGIKNLYQAMDSAADGAALLDLTEAQLLRSLGFSKPILLLEGIFSVSDIAACQALNLTAVVHNFEQLAMYQSLPPSGKALPVNIKLNTGMNRLGFSPSQMPALIEALGKTPQIKVEEWITHFANADTDADTADAADASSAATLAPSAKAQLERFAAMLRGVPSAWQAPCSASNSAGILRLDNTPFASQRAGILSYGGATVAGLRGVDSGLRPVMQLTSEIIAIQNLAAGDTVGYGSTFTAPQAMQIGIVACGYADGYPRHAPSGTPIAVAGQLTQTVGRVSMDMLAVNLSSIRARIALQLGSPVELWGERVSIDDVALAAGTISYELMCAVAPRVPKFVANLQP